MENSSVLLDQESPGRKESNWGQKRRLEFIDFRLRWDRRLNRSDLTNHFGISVPQASLDIAKYLELAPNNLIYDRGLRIYLATGEFKSLYPTSDAQCYLNELLTKTIGVTKLESGFIGWHPRVAIAPSPGRLVKEDILSNLINAIRDKKAVRVLYQSMSRPEPGERVLAPHALGHDGYRWHVRAFCYERKRFLDFVVARMLSIEAANVEHVDVAEDKEWNTAVRLVIIPNPQ